MSGSNSLADKHDLMFGPYRFRVRERVLERHGKPVAIPEKTLEVLCILLAHAGELVEKETLKEKVWPGIFVEDTNIAFQISTLRRLLDESATAPQLIATVPKRGYRFIGEVREEPPWEATKPDTPEDHQPEITPSPPERRLTLFDYRIGIGAAVLVVLISAVTLLMRSRPMAVSALTQRGNIVLADFENKTGEPVFDGTLRQGLLVELEQSPFLSLLSEQSVQRTMRLMRQPPGAHLTHDVAMGICQRTGSTLLVEGSIERVGGLYVLGLRALDCDAGNLVDAEQAKTDSRERVLDVLSSMAMRFRARVGESAATLQRHNISLAEATTSSADALQAYTTGWGLHTTRGASEAIPLLRHAVQLDPEFAMAYAALGRMYADVDESDLSAGSLQKAWELKDHTSNREHFFIAVNYLSLVAGNLEEARKVAEAWVHTYPRDAVPHTLLSGILNKAAGRYEEAAAQARRAIQMDPDFGIAYYNLGVDNLYLQRLDAAASALAAATKRGLDIEEFQMLAYDLAFLRHDANAIAQIVSQTSQRPDAVNWVVNRESFRVAYTGHLEQGRRISEWAIAEAERSNQRERAGVWKAGQALRDAMTGSAALAKTTAAGALRLSEDREVQYGAGLAMALAGDSTRAGFIANALAKRWPEDTTIRFIYLPVIRAQIALNRGNPAEAIEILKQTAPMEMGVSRSPINTLFGALYPVYFRGLALCRLGRGSEAAVEFQKIVEHSGLVVSDPVGALVHLQLGRVYQLAGDAAKAKVAYEQFLDLWKDADANVPVLRAARSEYAAAFGPAHR